MLNAHIPTRAKGWLGAAALLLTGVAFAHGQSTPAAVKAAFVYNFTKFVEWPADRFSSPSSPLVIAIVGEDSLNGELERMVQGKEVGGRSIFVRHIEWKDAENCHVLFVPAKESDHFSSFPRIRSHHVLIIGETPGFVRRGGIVNLVLEGDHMRFEISGSAAHEAGLEVSSKLLSLAKTPG